MSAGHQLAELNVAQPRAPLDSAELAEFNALIDPVNAVADAARGFVWRLQDENGRATSFRAFDSETMLINLSVWESLDGLRAFVYRATAGGSHRAVMGAGLSGSSGRATRISSSGGSRRAIARISWKPSGGWSSCASWGRPGGHSASAAASRRR
jgi:hypothetical protein